MTMTRLVSRAYSVQFSPKGDSDETHRANPVANQGSCRVAGVMPGALLVRNVRMLNSGSVSQVEVGENPAKFAARQWRIVCVWVVPGVKQRRKR